MGWPNPFADRNACSTCAVRSVIRLKRNFFFFYFYSLITYARIETAGANGRLIERRAPYNYIMLLLFRSKIERIPPSRYGSQKYRKTILYTRVVAVRR